jgi:hypothetical protein
MQTNSEKTIKLNAQSFNLITWYRINIASITGNTIDAWTILKFTDHASKQ